MTRVVRRLRFLIACLAGLVGMSLGAAAASAQSSPAPAAASADGRGVVVPAGRTTADDIVLLRGDVDVYGTVTGDVIALAGTVTVHPGGRVTGDAVSMLGETRVLPGATVGGDATSLARAGQPSTAVVPTGPRGVGEAMLQPVAWFLILLLIGIGVLVAGSSYLDGVTETLEQGLGRSLLAGIAGQLLLLPTLVVGIVLLAVTLVGVLAIPLGVVAFVLAAAGLLTLGFLAVAFLTGRALTGARGGFRATAARGPALRALTVGLVVYFALWLAAGAVQGVPAVAVTLRAAALALTWVAATAGFGATLLSRAGSRPPGRPAARGAGAVGTVPVERDGIPVWQTPTPIGGIVAARRPTTVPPRAE